jgi:glycosyl transferase family 87
MIPAIAVAGEGKTLRLKKLWPHYLVLTLLPLLIGLEALLAIYYIPQALQGFDDFRQLYVGGYMIRTGHAAELYDYDIQQSFQERLVPIRGHITLLISHLAYEELLFVPLSLLPYRIAYWVFMAFNGALLVLCVRLLRHRLKVLSDRWKWLPVLLILAFFPISRTLEKGQDSIIMLTLLAAASWALDREKEFVAGLLVGIGIVKFQIVIPIALLFLMWRRWRFSAGLAVSSVAAVLVSLWLVGLAGARDYAHMLLSMSLRLTSEADIHRYSTLPRTMLNLRGLFSAIFDGRLSHGYVQFLIAACSLVVLLAAAKQRPSLPLAIAAASLVSYHFIVHDASILVIVIAAALCSESVWQGAVAALLLIAPFCAINHIYGYLAAIPLLGLFLLMLGRVPEPSEFTVGGRQNAIAEESPCR